MFFLRGLLISVSVFVLAYALLSTVVALGWRVVARAERWSASAARPLFAFRIAPVLISSAVVALFAVPSFLRFEPRLSDEGIGPVPLFLAIIFCALGTAGVWRVASALRRTNSLVASWLRNGREERVIGVPVITASGDVPAVALTGICRSRLLISRAAAANLDAQELARAVEHEMAHLRSRDNLKKLLLQAVAFPGMRALDRAWANAAELSADAEAVHSETEALELASALVKISKLRALPDVPVLASGLVDGPCSLLELRVDRLMNWKAAGNANRFRINVLIAAGLLVITLLSNYGAVLHLAHSFTEAIVR